MRHIFLRTLANVGDAYWIGQLESATGIGIENASIDQNNNIWLALSRTFSNNVGIFSQISASGKLKWQLSVNGSYCRGIQANNDSIYVANKEYGFIKYDQLLNIKWQRGLMAAASGPEVDPSADANLPVSTAISPSGNIYVTGRVFVTVSGATSTAMPIIAKYSSSGSLEWVYRGNDLNYFISHSALTLGSNENIYLFFTHYAGGGYESGWLVKISSAGSIAWQRRLVPSPVFGFSGRVGVAVDSLDNAYVCASGYNNNKTLIAKYSSAGILLWSRLLNGTDSSPYIGASLSIDSRDYVYVAAGLASSNGFVIAKFSAVGSLVWQRSFAGATEEYEPGQILINKKDEILVFAKGQDSPNKILIAKLPSDGSKTGTYGDFVYATSTVAITYGTSVTDSAGTFPLLGNRYYPINTNYTSSPAALSFDLLSL